MSENDKLTEQKIFEAATEVFMEKGMDGARMQDIADRACINKSLLHYYYRTKDHLFEAVFEMIFRNLMKKFAPVLDENLSLEEKIRFFFSEHIGFLQDNPRLPSFVLYEINRHPARVKKLLKKVNIEKTWSQLYNQHGEELRQYNITRESFPQILVTFVAMSVFPFAARGIVEYFLESSGKKFDSFVEERKLFAAEFMINSIATKKISG
jgi:TetR/AcrR family transcriptional regulator